MTVRKPKPSSLPSAEAPSGNGNRVSAKNLLRSKAEVLLPLGKNKLSTQLSESESLKLMHELQVHQVELEMQNDELANSRAIALNYSELYDFAPSGYFTLSREAEIIDLNFSAAKILDKHRSQLINNRFDFFISIGIRSIFKRFLEELFSGKEKANCEISLLVSGSSAIDVYLTGIAAQNKDKCFISAFDITEHNKSMMEIAKLNSELLRQNEEKARREEELKIKNQELQAANAEKDKFFSIIAHDLRGPFSGFLGLTELMAEGLPGFSSDEIQQMAFLMKKSAANIYHLLGNLLEWSRLQRGLINIIPSSFFLRQKIAESLILVIDAASKKRITVNYEISDDLIAYADENMLEGTVRNLAMNAVKFTYTGGRITVSAKSIAHNVIEISVRDTGIGMNKNMIANLFNLNVNTKREGTEGEYSTGMGLILCKDFIKMNGGELWVESEEGKGTTFYFTVPSKLTN
ncbi:MAG: PAS domain-containing sensor histidine kinase [Mariniphaga sp.]